MNLRDFANWVYAAFTKMWNRMFTDEARISALEKRVTAIEGASKQITDLAAVLKSSGNSLTEAESKVKH